MLHNNDTNNATVTDSTRVRLYEITVPRDRGLVLGHGWASWRGDESRPVHVMPDGAYPVTELPDFAMTHCPHCDARQSVHLDEIATIVVTWHADGCPWYESVLEAAA